MRVRHLSVLLLALAVLGAASSGQSPPLSKPEVAPRVDLLGDPLPPGALARCGSGRLRHTECIPFLAFAPDGTNFVTCGSESYSLWDTATGKRRACLPIRKKDPQDRSGYPTCHAAYATDGRTVTCLCVRNEEPVECVILDVPQGRVPRRTLFQNTGSPVVTLAVAPDGKQIALGRRDLSIRFHDAWTGDETVRFQAAGKRLDHVAFSPDGRTLTVCSWDGTVRLHDVASGEIKDQLRFPGLYFETGYYSRDGQRLAVLSSPPTATVGKPEPQRLLVWDVTTRKVLSQVVAPAAKVVETDKVMPPSPPSRGEIHFRQVKLSPDGRFLLHDDPQGHFIVREAATAKEVKRLGPFTSSDAVAYAPDGKTLAASFYGHILLWDTSTWELLPCSRDPLREAWQLHFSGDGKRLVAAGNVALAWEPTTGREVHRIPSVAKFDWYLAVSPNEKYLASKEGYDRLTLWDAATGQALHTWQVADHLSYAPIFSPDNQRLAAPTLRRMHVFDVRSKKQILDVSLPGHPMGRAFSPNGRWLACVSVPVGRGQSEVPLWDLATGREMPPVDAGHFLPCYLAFSPDGRFLAISDAGENAAGKQYHHIRLWDLERKVWGRSFQVTQGSSGVSDMAWSPDSRRLASGADCVRVWEIASGQQCTSWTGHVDNVRAVAFSPDGSLLASASLDAPIFVWDVHGRLAQPLAAAEMEQAWLDLQSTDASIAFHAMQRLAATSKLTVPFLQARLQPAKAVTEAQVRELIDRLDSPQFAVREQAVMELQQVAEQRLPLLRKVLQGQPSAEVRRRLEEIVKQADAASPELLRSLRAMEVLEWIGTPEVLPILDRLAGGAAEATLTQEAKASARRLRTKSRG